MSQPRWDLHFLRRALLTAEMSKDPSTQVGAILTRGNVQISDGFNGFPRGIADNAERLHDRETKYKIVVHAERNAILNAARLGITTLHTTLYIAAKDTLAHTLWGRWCCTGCAIEAIQAGIQRIVWPAAPCPERWQEDANFSRKLMQEAGISIEEIEVK